MNHLKRAFSILFVMLLALVSLQAQHKNQEDVIYLKNGIIIRGSIVQYVWNDYIKVETERGDLFVVSYLDIERIEKEDKPLKYKNKEKGLFNITEIGWVSTNNGEPWGLSNLGIQTITGYRLNKWIGAGAGIGLQGYNSIGTVPLFGSLQTGDIFTDRVIPYGFFNMGYSLAWDNNIMPNKDVDGGLFFNPGLGVKVKNRNTAMLFSLGYQMQKVSIHNPDGWWWAGNETKITMNRISLRVGMNF